MWVGHLFRFLLMICCAFLATELHCAVQFIVHLIFVRQDNNVIEQIYVVGHRRCRELVSVLLKLMSL